MSLIPPSRHDESGTFSSTLPCAVSDAVSKITEASEGRCRAPGRSVDDR